MYGIGNPFKLSLEDLKSIHETNKLVRQSQKQVKKNLKAIKNKKEYKSTQKEYDELMEKVTKEVAKNERNRKLIKKENNKSADTKKEEIKMSADIKKQLVELQKRISKTSELELSELLEKEIANPRISDTIISKILENKQIDNDIDRGWTIAIASSTQNLINMVIRLLTDVSYKMDENLDEPDKIFINGFIQKMFNNKFKLYPNSKVSKMEIEDIDHERFNVFCDHIYSSVEAKKLFTPEVMNKIHQAVQDRKNGVVEVIDNPKVLPAPPMSDQEKLDQVVIKLDLEEPVTIEEPVQMFAPASSNSTSNIRYLHKYLFELLGGDVVKNFTYYEDKANGFINVNDGKTIFLVDPANIYGFGIWSIMALSANIISVNGRTYNDTVMVPLKCKEIVKKIFTGNYIVSINECEAIKKAYCFDNMVLYKFFDLSATNSSAGLALFDTIDKIKAFGKKLEGFLPLTQGFRFRVTDLVSETSFRLVSDLYVRSPLASNGETAMPSAAPVELTMEMLKAA